MHPETPVEAAPEPENDKFFTPPLIIIFVTVFIDLIGFGMVIPILPYYANISPFNATPVEIGFLMSSYSWAQFFFSSILGRLSDQFGRRPILFISLLGSAVGYFVIGAANTLFLVFLGRIISGITGGNISTAQAYIADVTSKKNRAKGMGLFGAAFGIGFVLGPGISGILSEYGVHVPFYFAAALSLVNAAALFFFLPESIKPGHAPPVAGKNRFVQIFESLAEKQFRAINIIYFLLVTSFSIMTYAFVLYTGYKFAYTPVQNGYLFAFIGVIAIFGQGFLFSLLVKQFGEPPVIAAGSIMMVASLFAVPLVGPQSGGLAGLLIGSALLAFGNSLASPGLTSLASKSADESVQGKTMGIMQSGASLARAIGPMIGGFLLNNAVNAVDDFTIYRTFWTASAIMLAAFFVSLFLMKSREAKVEKV